MNNTIHVVLVTYGEPPMASFRAQFNYSIRILRQLTTLIDAIPKPLIPLISCLRALNRVKKWRREQYSSPLESITEQQAQALEQELRLHGLDVQTYVAYAFRNPSMELVLEQLSAKDPGTLVWLPMYVFDSDFTSGMIDESKYIQPLTRKGWRVKTLAVDLLHPQLAEAAAEFVMREVKKHGWDEETLKRTGLILATHGTLTHPPATIKDSGLRGAIRYYVALRKKFAPVFGAISITWLNHVRGGQWTQPELPRVFNTLRGKGISRFIYYPYGFLADNAETQLEGRDVYRGIEGIDIFQVLCLNSDPLLIGVLAQAVMRELASATDIA